jgi:hypothetical protein
VRGEEGGREVVAVDEGEVGDGYEAAGGRGHFGDGLG